MSIISIPAHSHKYPGLFALVDEADYPLVCDYRWNAVLDFNTFYAVRTWQEGRRSNRISHTVRMHRQIIIPPPGMVIDHIDRNGLNNTRANLRLCTDLQNRANRNMMAANTSGFTGVSFSKRNSKWKSTIHHAGAGVHLGYYATPEEAARAYDAAAIELRGEFAQLNFPLKP
jgi:hypothetical protein